MSESPLVIPSMEEVILLAHPRHFDDAKDYADTIRGRYPGTDIQTFKTKSGGWEPNAAALEAYREDRPAVAVGVFGGDGTFRDIGEGLLRSPSLAGSIAIGSLGGGYGFDNRTGQRGSRLAARFVSPKRFMTRSEPVTAHALECNHETAKGEQLTTYAMSYIGAGKSAIGAARVATEAYREGNSFCKDVGTVVRTLRNPASFEVTQLRAEDDLRKPRRREIGDVSFVNGPRMAKLARFSVLHGEPAFEVAQFAPGPWAAAKGMLQLLAGKAPTVKSQKAIEFTPMGEDLPVHFDGDILAHDGEKIVFPRLKLVRIGLAEATYTLLVSPKQARRTREARSRNIR